MEKSDKRKSRGLLPGLIVGIIITLVLVVIGMRSLMIVEHESPLGFDETVAALEKSITDNGWIISGMKDLNKSLKNNGVEFKPRVRLIQLCNPHHAAEVLTDARHVACLMPCTFAVYEDDEGGVKISKMNTGLMGKVFGGTISRVMGGAVSEEEAKILAAVLERE